MRCPCHRVALGPCHTCSCSSLIHFAPGGQFGAARAAGALEGAGGGQRPEGAPTGVPVGCAVHQVERTGPGLGLCLSSVSRRP